MSIRKQTLWLGAATWVLAASACSLDATGTREGFKRQLPRYDDGGTDPDGSELVFPPTNNVELWARSVALIVPDRLLDGAKVSDLPTRPMAARNDGCEGPYDQPLQVQDCAGVLVAPDELLTAGQCIYSQSQCERTSVVFDYEVSGQSGFSDRYGCERILARGFEDNGPGFTLIRLDRAVRDRDPLAVRTVGRIKEGAWVALPGSPLVEPANVHSNGVVAEASPEKSYFVSDAHVASYTPVSGLPVLGHQTGRIEGLRTAGKWRFFETPLGDCFARPKCAEEIAVDECAPVPFDLHADEFDDHL